MKKLTAMLLILCLLALACCAEEETESEPEGAVESAVEEITVELGGDSEEEIPEPRATKAPKVREQYWDEEDCIIPYPDVTSSEIKNQLKSSDRVYPGKLVWPLPGTPVLGHITSHVGWRNAARIHSHQGGDWPSWLHHGIDVGHVTKNQSVVAAADGMAWAGKRRGDGNYVVIDHGNGWYTEYQHLSRFAGAVYRNCKKVPVKAGDPIGYVGNSGGDYPVHFHFEIAYSPKGKGGSAGKYFKLTKNRAIRAYSFPQECVIELHWAKTWEICTAEKQHFVASAEDLKEETKE